MKLRRPVENILFQWAYNRSVFAGISTGYVIKQLVHAFSCACIELWMHLGSLENTQEANSYASLVLSKLPACIHNSMNARLSMNQLLITLTLHQETLVP